MKKVVVILSLLSPLPLFALPANNPPLQEIPALELNIVINKITSANHHPYLNNHIFLSYKKALDELYFLSPHHLLWIDSQNPEKHKIDAVLQLLSNATESGLNPEHYNFTSLKKHWQKLSNNKKASHSDQALLDTAITINLLHLLSDLHFGRINPISLDVNYNNKQNALTFIPPILKAIKDNTISQLPDRLEPAHPTYQQLKQVLLEYQNKEPREPVKSLQYTQSIRPDEISPQVIEIRQQLRALNGLTAEENPSFIYDQLLVTTIKSFQFHHGLKDDGIIGKNTLKALNTPLSQRIWQIKLALERFRWLPKTRPSPLIMVNIPAFQLRAYHPDSNNIDKPQTLDMKVIVGKSKDNKSPVFTADMYYLEFSPYWNIPNSITFDEILPKLEENPLYIEQQNMELVSGFHNDEAGQPYSEDLFEQLQSGALKLRQRPGKGNSLGKVKFIFPNNYNVYLHDTPSRHLFRKSKRDLSHGCIRVEKPTELASFLLQTKQGWSQRAIKKAMHLPSPKKVWLKKSVPVIIYYSTASVEQGEVFFYNDIYGYDTKLSQALMKHLPSPSLPIVNISVPTIGEISFSKIQQSTIN